MISLLLWLALAFPGELPGADIGGNLPSGFEPSGAVWHTRLERLFVVHDGGTLVSMDATGNDIQTWAIGGDLEGVTVADHERDLVYIGVEQPDSILEYDIVQRRVLRSFDLTPWMQSASSNYGLESLTYVDGVFIAGLQETGDLYRFVLPPTGTAVTFLDVANPAEGRRYISGSDYTSGVLYLAWDNSNLLRAVEPEPPYALIEEWDLPGYGQEGIALSCPYLFVAEDSAGAYTVVRRYGFGQCATPVVLP